MNVKNESKKEKNIKENKKIKMLNPKTDIVFQMLFSSVNPEITKGLISSMIEEIPNLKELQAHTKWQIREEKTHTKILTDRLEIHIIEIPKAIKEYRNNKKNEVLQWMMFLNEPESMEVEEIMKENKEIEQAKITLRELSEEEENQRIAELREKHILDTQDIYKTGIEKGRKEEKINVTKKLLDMNISIEKIVEITEMSKEEIEKLKSENK